MKQNTVGKSHLASWSPGSPVGYSLDGDYIVGALFGIIPLCRIHLGAIHYLRLASRTDSSPLYFLFNWPCFLFANRRSLRPVYILQTRKGQRTMLKLEGGAHFRLRQAIARHSTHRPVSRKAA